MSIERITLAEFHRRIGVWQDYPHRQDIKLVCPLCETPQSINDFIALNDGRTLEQIERGFGYSCIGRHTGAGSPRKKPDGKPCNWSLGGLFRLHKLEVETPDGEVFPIFTPHNPHGRPDPLEGAEA